MLTLDPSGRASETRFIVAAEWVGISTGWSCGQYEAQFVAGGTAHALDSRSQRVACGADAAELALFAVDFLTDEWALRCPECERQVRTTR